jgi:hypothetical protein
MPDTTDSESVHANDPVHQRVSATEALISEATMRSIESSVANDLSDAVQKRLSVLPDDVHRKLYQKYAHDLNRADPEIKVVVIDDSQSYPYKTGEYLYSNKTTLTFDDETVVCTGFWIHPETGNPCGDSSDLQYPSKYCSSFVESYRC